MEPVEVVQIREGHTDNCRRALGFSRSLQGEGLKTVQWQNDPEIDAAFNRQSRTYSILDSYSPCCSRRFHDHSATAPFSGPLPVHACKMTYEFKPCTTVLLYN
jgi:hypothetical protein